MGVNFRHLWYKKILLTNGTIISGNEVSGELYFLNKFKSWKSSDPTCVGIFYCYNNYKKYYVDAQGKVLDHIDYYDYGQEFEDYEEGYIKEIGYIKSFESKIKKSEDLRIKELEEGYISFSHVDSKISGIIHMYKSNVDKKSGVLQKKVFDENIDCIGEFHDKKNNRVLKIDNEGNIKNNDEIITNIRTVFYGHNRLSSIIVDKYIDISEDYSIDFSKYYFKKIDIKTGVKIDRTLDRGVKTEFGFQNGELIIVPPGYLCEDKHYDVRGVFRNYKDNKNYLVDEEGNIFSVEDGKVKIVGSIVDFILLVVKSKDFRINERSLMHYLYDLEGISESRKSWAKEVVLKNYTAFRRSTDSTIYSCSFWSNGISGKITFYLDRMDGDIIGSFSGTIDGKKVDHCCVENNGLLGKVSFFGKFKEMYKIDIDYFNKLKQEVTKAYQQDLAELKAKQQELKKIKITHGHDADEMNRLMYGSGEQKKKETKENYNEENINKSNEENSNSGRKCSIYRYDGFGPEYKIDGNKIYRYGGITPEYKIDGNKIYSYSGFGPEYKIDGNKIYSYDGFGPEYRIDGDKIYRYGEVSPEYRIDGRCFLTTACVEAKGLPDDCYELQTLREFRDKYLMNSESGNRAVENYYKIAPHIVNNINKLDNRIEIYKDLYDRLVLGSIKYIEQEEYDKAFKNYTTITLDLKKRYYSQK